MKELIDRQALIADYRICGRCNSFESCSGHIIMCDSAGIRLAINEAPAIEVDLIDRGAAIHLFEEYKKENIKKGLFKDAVIFDTMVSFLKNLPSFNRHSGSRERMTNGDKIRSMTDEELAERLNSFICDNRESGACKRFKNCEECKRSWVREEATTDAEIESEG